MAEDDTKAFNEWADIDEVIVEKIAGAVHDAVEGMCHDPATCRWMRNAKDAIRAVISGEGFKEK